jgi:polyhydroxyalkanoate synthase
LDLAGLGPIQSDYRIVAETPGAKLRSYSPQGAAGRPVLIIPAPFKQPYIWDLTPEVSVVRQCLRRRARVFLLEWTHPAHANLSDYTDRLPSFAMQAVEAETGRPSGILAGHSLGGTFAAIFASLHPDRVDALWLIDAPLAFARTEGGPLAEALAATPQAAAEVVGADPWPGSLISLLSSLALPGAFILDRWRDFASSLADRDALALHLRVIRWTLDEVPLPRRMVAEVLQQLYKEDRFMRGTLAVDGKVAAVEVLRGSIVAVVNPASRLVPPRSLLAGLEKAAASSCQVLTYEADPGCVLQHLGPLVSRKAHAGIWPQVLEALRSDEAAHA